MEKNSIRRVAVDHAARAAAVEHNKASWKVKKMEIAARELNRLEPDLSDDIKKGVLEEVGAAIDAGSPVIPAVIAIVRQIRDS